MAGLATCNEETQRRVHLVGITFIFLNSICFCFNPSSISNKAVTTDSNYGLQSSDSSSSTFEKYMMQSYFEKYESLHDSTFQDFIAQEEPFGLCKALPNDLNFVPRLSSLRRSLIGEGSHRHLSSSMTLDIQLLQFTTDIPPHNCAVIHVERLPYGVYADPFELQHLLQHGEFTDIVVFGDTNLESPSFLSNRSAVEVHMDVGPLLSRSKNERDVVVELPLHARYAPLHQSGYWNVQFGEPDLYMRCSVESHNIEGSSSIQSCLYAITNENADIRYGTMVWKIPCGIKAHAGIVYVFTFISAFVATLLIVLTTMMHSNSDKCKHAKKF